MSFNAKKCICVSVLLALIAIMLWDCETPEVFDPYADWDYHQDFEYHSFAHVSSERCRILIIGNSLTYFNDQPKMLSNLARENNRRAFVDEISFPGVQMREHYKDEYTLRKIREQDWDFVILQEAVGDVASPDNHDNISKYVEVLRDSILSNCAETMIFYFLPWGLKSGYGFEFITIPFEDHQMNLTAGTVEFASSLDLMVAPVGEAWLNAISDTAGIELFYSDGAHPSYYGSFLGACVYYAAIFQDSLTDDYYRGWKYEYLKKVAYSTVMDSLEKWNIPILEDLTRWVIPTDDDLIPLD